MYGELLPEIQDVLRQYCTLEDLKNLSLTCHKNCDALRPYVFHMIRLPIEPSEDVNYCFDERMTEYLQYTEILVLSEYLSPNIFQNVDFKSLQALYMCGCENISEGNFGILCNALPNIIELCLSTLELDHSHFAHLKKLVSLEKFSIEHSDDEHAADAVCEHLGEMMSLKVISIFSCQYVTDSALNYLAGLINLQELSITDMTLISGLALASLNTLSSFRKLDLSHTYLGGESFVAIASIKTLEELILDGCGIDDDDFYHISTLTNLKKLDLSHSSIHEAAFQRIKALVLLEELVLFDSKTKITDGVVTSIALLPKLKVLNVANTGCSTDKLLPIIKGASKVVNIASDNHENLFCNFYSSMM